MGMAKTIAQPVLATVRLAREGLVADSLAAALKALEAAGSGSSSPISAESVKAVVEAAGKGKAGLGVGGALIGGAVGWPVYAAVAAGLLGFGIWNSYEARRESKQAKQVRDLTQQLHDLAQEHDLSLRRAAEYMRKHAAEREIYLDLTTSTYDEPWQIFFDIFTAKEDELEGLLRKHEGFYVTLGGYLERHFEKFENLLNLAQEDREELRALVNSLPDQLLPHLEQISHQPWRQPSERPFHFTRRETRIRGGEATELLREASHHFLAAELPFCWWMWTGLEGAGKSRLAMELCAEAEEDGWYACFVHTGMLEEFSAEFWLMCRFPKRTLLVVDYVGYDPDGVRRLLGALSNRRTNGVVRVVLLERFVVPLEPCGATVARPYWANRLFRSEPPDDALTEAILERQYPQCGAPSRHLSGLATADVGQVVGDYLESQKHARDDALSDRVATIIGRGSARPLHAQIAAQLLIDRPEMAAGTFDEVMAAWLDRAIATWQRRLREVHHFEQPKRFLALLCIACIVERLPWEQTPVDSALPGADELETSSFLTVFGQHPGATEITALQPDLLGEWFVFSCAAGWCQSFHLDPEWIAATAVKTEGAAPAIRHFVERTYRVFRNERLWRLLRSTLGRYSSPFGEVFDHQMRLQQLLGGTVDAAQQTYHAEVCAQIERCHAEELVPADPFNCQRAEKALVIDLMAGGTKRIETVLETYATQAHVIAIDRDIVRLRQIEQTFPESLSVYRREIGAELGTPVGLQAMIEESTWRATPQCELVVARKALHELPWEQQVALIKEVGEVTRIGGRAVFYTDSPTAISEQGWERWLLWEKRLLQTLGAEQVGERPQGEAAWSWLLPPHLQFDPTRPDDWALFCNLWLRLKDWANYNLHEWRHRYFSSRNQLESAFASAGFAIDAEAGAEVWEHHMELQAARFVEDPINRLGYLAYDGTVTQQEIDDVFRGNDRYEFFCRFSEAHLWDGNGPTAIGELMGAHLPEPIKVSALLQDVISLPADIETPAISGPAFRMPVHIFSLPRVAQESSA
jgi:hypothetical protein